MNIWIYEYNEYNEYNDNFLFKKKFNGLADDIIITYQKYLVDNKNLID